MPGDEPDRVQGVDFSSVAPALEAIPYPITVAELVARHGDREVERTNAGPITVRELFRGVDDDTFESAEEVRQTMLALMPRGSVGRAGYSDRGGSTPSETAAAEELDEDESV